MKVNFTASAFASRMSKILLSEIKSKYAPSMKIIFLRIKINKNVCHKLSKFSIYLP